MSERVKCLECGAEHDDDALRDFEDVTDLLPGDEIPAGRCPAPSAEEPGEPCDGQCLLLDAPWWREKLEHNRQMQGVGAIQRPRLSAPGSTLEDMQNDAKALAMLAALATVVLERDNPGQSDPGSVEACGKALAWARQRLAETENTIAALDGSGMPELVTARVLVTLDGGLVQNVDCDVPGVVVVVADVDEPSEDHPCVVRNAVGDLVHWNTWEPTGDDVEREAIAAAWPLAEKAAEQHEAYIEGQAEKA